MPKLLYDVFPYATKSPKMGPLIIWQLDKEFKSSKWEKSYLTFE